MELNLSLLFLVQVSKICNVEVNIMSNSTTWENTSQLKHSRIKNPVEHSASEYFCKSSSLLKAAKSFLKNVLS